MSKSLKFTGPSRYGSIIELSDECFQHTHSAGYDSEFTICSIAIEEVEYELSNKKINCPTCIAMIEFYKQFKKGKDY